MTTIHDSFYLKKKQLLDARLVPVATELSLPVLNGNSDIPEGAIILVQDVLSNFQAQKDPSNPSNLIWVDISNNANVLAVGTINLMPTNTVLDLSTVTPPISTCHSVIINLLGGVNNATINNITNLPANQTVTFFTNAGQTVTFTHTDYDAAGVDSVVIEDGFDFTLVGRLDANESLTVQKQANKVCQVDATQYIEKSEIQQLIAATLNIADDLTTADPNIALSANQGVVIAAMIATKMNLFNIGTKLAWSGVSAPFTLNAQPFRFRTVNLIEPTLIDNVLVESYQPVDQDYFKVYFNVSEGSYILAPGDPSLYANWKQISPGINLPSGLVYETLDGNSTAAVANGPNQYLRRNQANNGYEFVSASQIYADIQNNVNNLNNQF